MPKDLGEGSGRAEGRGQRLLGQMGPNPGVGGRLGVCTPSWGTRRKGGAVCPGSGDLWMVPELGCSTIPDGEGGGPAEGRDPGLGVPRPLPLRCRLPRRSPQTRLRNRQVGADGGQRPRSCTKPGPTREQAGPEEAEDDDEDEDEADDEEAAEAAAAPWNPGPAASRRRRRGRHSRGEGVPRGRAAADRRPGGKQQGRDASRGAPPGPRRSPPPPPPCGPGSGGGSATDTGRHVRPVK